MIISLINYSYIISSLPFLGAYGGAWPSLCHGEVPPRCFAPRAAGDQVAARHDAAQAGPVRIRDGHPAVQDAAGKG